MTTSRSNQEGARGENYRFNGFDDVIHEPAYDSDEGPTPATKIVESAQCMSSGKAASEPAKPCEIGRSSGHEAPGMYPGKSCKPSPKPSSTAPGEAMSSEQNRAADLPKPETRFDPDDWAPDSFPWTDKSKYTKLSSAAPGKAMSSGQKGAAGAPAPKEQYKLADDPDSGDEWAPDTISWMDATKPTKPSTAPWKAIPSRESNSKLPSTTPPPTSTPWQPVPPPHWESESPSATPASSKKRKVDDSSNSKDISGTDTDLAERSNLSPRQNTGEDMDRAKGKGVAEVSTTQANIAMDSLKLEDAPQEERDIYLPPLERFGTTDAYLEHLYPILCNTLGLECNKEVLLKELDRFLSPIPPGSTPENPIDVDDYVFKSNVGSGTDNLDK